MNNDIQHLARLQDYYARHGVIPSFATIMSTVGFRSKSAAAALVSRLKETGHLETTADRRLRPGRRFFERPVFDSVRAGLPTPAADSRHDTLTIDEYLINQPSRTLLVTVKGDSMIDAGIHPGDIVVVEKRTDARVGDLVIAIINNEFTLKYLDKEKSRYILRPANIAYPVIRPQGDLEIFGIVIGQFRKYSR